MGALIHPSAVIHPSAELAADVAIGPYAVIGRDVRVGEGTVIGPHAVIEPGAVLGRRNRVHAGAVVGGDPQDLKFRGERTGVVLGDDNTIREYATLNRATGEGELTRIGSRNLIMAYVHVAHNCIIGDDVVLANAATLAGHVEIGDHVVIGGLSGLHQFVRVGAHAMVGGMTKIVQDVPPYMLADGNPPRVPCPNLVGLRRRGFATATRKALKEAHRLLYRAGLAANEAAEAIRALGDLPELAHLVAFVRASERGLVGMGDAEGTRAERSDAASGDEDA